MGLFESFGKDEVDKVKDGWLNGHVTDEENSDRLWGLSAIFQGWPKPDGWGKSDDTDPNEFF